MDENNNGPVPGIIGQDVPSEESTPNQVESAPKQDSGKIFDGSSFTGEEPQSLSFNTNGETKQEKKKGSNPFTKWQLWAILSGVISLAFIATVVIMSTVYNGKISDAGMIAQYDSAANTLKDNKAEFTEAFKGLIDNSYKAGKTVSSTKIYPDDSQQKTIISSCLGKYGVSDDDITYSDQVKTGADYYASGENVSSAKERLERISAGYSSASNAIESCKEDALKYVDDILDIKIGEFTTEPYAKNENYVAVSQKITIKNKSNRIISSLSLGYSLYNRDGVAIKERSVYKDYKYKLKPGETITLDLYGNTESYRYTVWNKDKEVEDMKNYKPVLNYIDGSFVVE